MEMTRERFSFTIDPRDMLLSLQMGFSFVRAAVACAILERTSGLEPSSETTDRKLPNVKFPFLSFWQSGSLILLISMYQKSKTSFCHGKQNKEKIPL